MKNQMEKILKEINEKQKEITTLYKSLRKLLKNYGQEKNKFLIVQNMERAVNDLEYVCEALSVTTKRVCSPERSTDVLIIRQSLAYIFNKKYGLSLVSIGKIFNRDHTTIINNIKRVDEAIWLYENKSIDSGITVRSLNTICEIVGVDKVQTKNVV